MAVKCCAVGWHYLANTSLWYYWFTYFALVVLFTYLCAYVLWRQQNIPEHLQKQGSFIPGYRPGEPTRGTAIGHGGEFD